MPGSSSSQDPQLSNTEVKAKTTKKSTDTSLTSLQKRVDESKKLTEKIELMMEKEDKSCSAESHYGVWLSRLIPQIDHSLIQEYYKQSFALTMQFVDKSIALCQQ